MVEWRPAGFYRTGAGTAAQAEDRTVQCTLCPFRCRLRDGEAGACKVRRRRGDTVETATLGTTVSHWDAVERKPFFHFRPGTRLLTLAPPGCSFRCDYCVNHRLSQYGRSAGEEGGEAGERDGGYRLVDPADVAGQAHAAGAGIGLSYSEPSLAAELTLRLAKEAAPLDVPIVWKSNGFLTPEAAEELIPALSAVNIDIKAADEDAHRRLTGAPLRPVLDTVRLMHDSGVWLEISTPLIPGTSATDDELARIAASIAAVDPGIPWHLLRFVPAYRLRDPAPTAPDRLARAVAIGRAAGLRHVYVERALGDAGRATYCPGCGTEVITRQIWGLAVNRLRANGGCPGCGTLIEGRWTA